MTSGEVDMSEFVRGRRLGEEVKRLLAGADVRVAVAFWGEGAAEALFGGSVPPDALLICDADSGGTNPDELKRLGAPDEPRLLHLPGLHAKVWSSSLGLLVGSANASGNGIGFSSEAKLVEAATLHAPGSRAQTAATAWFEELRARATQVDAGRLERARLAWARRSRGPRRVLTPPDPGSLLDAVSTDPERFRGVGFAFTSGTASAEERDDAARAVIAKDDWRKVSVLSRSVRAAVRAWPVQDVFSGWDPNDVSAWPGRFVCAHRNRRGRIGYWFYGRSHVAFLADGRGMVLAERPGTLRRSLGLPHGRETMADVDQGRLNSIFEALDEKGHRLFEDGEALSSFLADIAI